MRKVNFSKNIINLVIYILIPLVFTNSKCDRNIPLVETLDKNVFPLDRGKYRIYEVTDTTFTTTDTLKKHYFLKEVQGQFEKDLLNRNVQRLERYTSDTLTNFQFYELWTQYKDKEFAERIEGNTRYVVLKFPIKKGDSWDGNMYNSQDPQYYKYIAIDTTVVVRNRIFEHCVFVLKQKIEDSFIQNILSYEIYAPGIGRIKRYERHIKWIFDGQGNQQLDTDSYIYLEEYVTGN